MLVSRIITDARVLDPEFLPNDVVQRDAEINLLSSVLRPAVEGNPSDSAVLHGPSGTGKTCIAQYTLDKPHQSTLELNTQYVNCWEDHSHFTVLYRIFDGLDKTLDIYRQSTPKEVLSDRLYDYDGPPYIIILEEADQLDTTDVHVRDAPPLLIDKQTSLKVEIIEAHDNHLIAEPTGHSNIFRTDDVRGTKNDLLDGHQ